MEESKKKLVWYILAALVVVGLILAIVGMLIGVVSVSGGGESESIKLSDEGWELAEISTAFLTIAFVITIIGAAALVAEAVLRIFVGKDIKILRICGAAVALIGGILVIVAGFMLAGKVWDMYAPTEAIKDAMKAAGMSISPAAGVWLGGIGGILAAVGGGLVLLKQFN